jgi:hypothetical protein
MASRSGSQKVSLFFFNEPDASLSLSLRPTTGPYSEEHKFHQNKHAV